MTLDYEDFRKHFAGLSDEALEEIDRDELVELAQQAYDEAIAERGIDLEIKHIEKRSWSADSEEVPLEETPHEADWMEHSVAAASWSLFAGNSHTPEAAEARSALEAVGIPCELVRNEPEEPGALPILELRVPGKLSLQAISVLDQEIFNPQMVADWQVHFESLTDEELRAVNPAMLVAGLLDRAQRMKQAYEDELARRASA
ncbi:MAG: hypothetical protein ABI811_14455 [Acidobacteriota bacterium]